MEPQTAAEQTAADPSWFSQQWDLLWPYAPVVIAGALVGLAVFLLVWRPLRKLMGLNERLWNAQAFFGRAMLVTFVLGGMAPVIGTALPVERGASFMEYVWAVGGQLQYSVLYVALFLFGYSILLAVLAASLGRFRD